MWRWTIGRLRPCLFLCLVLWADAVPAINMRLIRTAATPFERKNELIISSPFCPRVMESALADEFNSARFRWLITSLSGGFNSDHLNRLPGNKPGHPHLLASKLTGLFLTGLVQPVDDFVITIGQDKLAILNAHQRA